jgi:hypothetical protein
VRGLVIGVLVLTGLQVMLASPASRVAALFGRPAGWLAAWMDPSRPLIPEGHLSGAAAPRPGTSTGGGGGKNPQPAPGTGPGGILPLVTGLLP